MRDIKIIFWVKVTYIDVLWPPTSWVERTWCHRDRASWWKFRGSQNRVKWAVQPISRYLNFKNSNFLYENNSDTNADEAGHSQGNSCFSHKFFGDSTHQAYAMMGDFRKCGISQHDPPNRNFGIFPRLSSCAKIHFRGVRGNDDQYESC